MACPSPLSFPAHLYQVLDVLSLYIIVLIPASRTLCPLLDNIVRNYLGAHFLTGCAFFCCIQFARVHDPIQNPAFPERCAEQNTLAEDQYKQVVLYSLSVSRTDIVLSCVYTGSRNCVDSGAHLLAIPFNYEYLHTLRSSHSAI
jgi:hypothetical protein